MTLRPVLFVLAGVNGAGKSSIGGHLLTQAGLDWFNPDTFARELVIATGCDQTWANGQAWKEGMRRLTEAVTHGTAYAFETTLGGRTVPARIQLAAQTHDVHMWFCGLSSPALHIARVKARVAAGGHDIPEDKIRQRYPAALKNLIALLPAIAHLRVYDNSLTAQAGQVIPDPNLIGEFEHGQLIWPSDPATLATTPEWAKPILAATFG